LKIPERECERERAGGIGGEAKDEIGRYGARAGTGIGPEIAMNIEAEPDEAADAA